MYGNCHSLTCDHFILYLKIEAEERDYLVQNKLHFKEKITSCIIQEAGNVNLQFNNIFNFKSLSCQ